MADPKKDYAAVHRDADGREVYPAEPFAVIVTGVPRAGRDDDVETPTSEPSRDRECNSTRPPALGETGGRDAATTIPATGRRADRSDPIRLSCASLRCSKLEAKGTEFYGGTAALTATKEPPRGTNQLAIEVLLAWRLLRSATAAPAM